MPPQQKRERGVEPGRSGLALTRQVHCAACLRPVRRARLATPPPQEMGKSSEAPDLAGGKVTSGWEVEGQGQSCQVLENIGWGGVKIYGWQGEGHLRGRCSLSQPCGEDPETAGQPPGVKGGPCVPRPRRHTCRDWG